MEPRRINLPRETIRHFVAPQGRSVAVEGLRLCRYTLRSLFSVLRGACAPHAHPCQRPVLCRPTQHQSLPPQQDTPSPDLSSSKHRPGPCRGAGTHRPYRLKRPDGLSVATDGGRFRQAQRIGVVSMHAIRRGKRFLMEGDRHPSPLLQHLERDTDFPWGKQ